LAAAARYGAHLEQLARRTPELLVAHAYTRTLGDLSGGQLLRRSLQQALGLGSEGCAFFAFPAIAELGAYKADYRATLDALPLDGPTRARIVVEAQLAFELNEALTRELASPVPLAG
jgi:heme oxygenase